MQCAQNRKKPEQNSRSCYECADNYKTEQPKVLKMDGRQQPRHE